MADARIRCINKVPRNDTHHGITHVGGDGWKWPRQDVIASIEARTNSFYTLVNGKRADVAVVSDHNGKYLRIPRGRLLQRQLAGVARVR